MLTTSSSGVSRTTVANLYNNYQQPAERVSRPAEPANAHHYDSITISNRPSDENRFQMDLVSRLAKEIRTSTTTGDIQALREQVASGTYQVDASAIAARMLHLVED